MRSGIPPAIRPTAGKVSFMYDLINEDLLLLDIKKQLPENIGADEMI